MKLNEEVYLGDAVYASFDGWHVWLKTHGSGNDQAIGLEPAVFYALAAYQADVMREFGVKKDERPLP